MLTLLLERLEVSLEVGGGLEVHVDEGVEVDGEVVAEHRPLLEAPGGREHPAEEDRALAVARDQAGRVALDDEREDEVLALLAEAAEHCGQLQEPPHLLVVLGAQLLQRRTTCTAHESIWYCL